MGIILAVTVSPAPSHRHKGVPDMHICSSLAVLLLYVLLVSLASALVVDKTIFLRQLTDFEQFGFAANGTIALRVSTDSPQANVSVFICQDKQFDQLTSTSDPSSIDFCSNTEFKTCEYYVDHNEGVQQHYRVQTKNRYRIFYQSIHSSMHLVILLIDEERFVVGAVWLQEFDQSKCTIYSVESWR